MDARRDRDRLRPGATHPPEAFSHAAAGLADEIAAALLRLHWVGVSTPDRARYHLRGKVRSDRVGRLRATVILFDATNGRSLWADQLDGTCVQVFAFEEHVVRRLSAAIEPALRDAEIDRASRIDRGRADLLASPALQRRLSCPV